MVPPSSPSDSSDIWTAPQGSGRERLSGGGGGGGGGGERQPVYKAGGLRGLWSVRVREHGGGEGGGNFLGSHPGLARRGRRIKVLTTLQSLFLKLKPVNNWFTLTSGRSRQLYTVSDNFRLSSLCPKENRL